MSHKDEETTGHDFDGIQEMDNPMPRWWLYLFYACIIWGALYLAYHWAYSAEINRLSQANNASAWSGTRLALENKANNPEETIDWSIVNQDNVDQYIKDPALVTRGKSLYSSNCAACHGASAEGVVGPSLVDAQTVYGNLPKEIFEVIANGRLDKGMPGWDKTLGRKNAVALTAYVLSLQK